MDRPRQYLDDKRVDHLLETVETCSVADWTCIREKLKHREHNDLLAWLAYSRHRKTSEPLTWLLDTPIEPGAAYEIYENAPIEPGIPYEICKQLPQRPARGPQGPAGPD